MTCKDCGSGYDDRQIRCGHCGTKNPNPIKRDSWEQRLAERRSWNRAPRVHDLVLKLEEDAE